MSRLPEPAPVALSFQFLAEIASGATTRVDLCRSVGPHRPGELLAVKRLLPHLAGDPMVATRFFDEVRTTAALKHPNVVEVAGWGTDEQGTYFAVELVQGVSLARLMKTVFDTGEVFPERLVVHIGATICRGLAAAHELRSPQGELLNLVHRDLTPGNVLVGFQGEVKIADFGLAKSSLRVANTLVGSRKGTTTYMAPEQARGGPADRRSDLFSLGILLFELFAGRHPWPAAGDHELLRSMATLPAADLRELRPKIDKELVAIVMRCLERDPSARFQGADEILARLDGWLHSHGYLEGNEESLGRFVRRNAMRQMRWFERAVSGNLAGVAAPRPSLSEATGTPRRPTFDAMRERASSTPDRFRGGVASRAQEDDATDFEPRVSALPGPLSSPSLREADTVDDGPRRRGPLPSAEVSEEKTVVVGSSGRGRAEPAALAGGGRPRGSQPSYGSIPLEGNAAPPTSADAAPAEGASEGERRLHAEADRLTTEAIRLREEARFAVAHADRKLAMAKAAAHLSSMAAEALRASASSGAQQALRRLDEALALERAMHKAMSAPLTLAPEASAGPVSWGREQRAILAQLGLEHLAPPAASQLPDLGAPAQVRPPALPDDGALSQRTDAAHATRGAAGGASAAAGAADAVSGADTPLGAPSSTEAIQFQASLRPMVLGMPRALALAVAAAAFAAFVLAWIYS
ncbi:protein kinase [Sorangium sp. So ce1036]|uniref:serine/threonine-protein kinase n=1 Tax=Sorangium sp. So ce1036 TaxID=3133328 RepID=UPI003F0CC040